MSSPETPKNVFFILFKGVPLISYAKRTFVVYISSRISPVAPSAQDHRREHWAVPGSAALCPAAGGGGGAREARSLERWSGPWFPMCCKNMANCFVGRLPKLLFYRDSKVSWEGTLACGLDAHTLKLDKSACVSAIFYDEH